MKGLTMFSYTYRNPGDFKIVHETDTKVVYANDDGEIFVDNRHAPQIIKIYVDDSINLKIQTSNYTVTTLF